MERKTIRERTDYFLVDDFSGDINEIIERLKRIDKETKEKISSASKIMIYPEYDFEGGVEFYIEIERLETDEEINARLFAEQVRKKKENDILISKREAELKLLKELKLKYEGDLNGTNN